MSRSASGRLLFVVLHLLLAAPLPLAASTLSAQPAPPSCGVPEPAAPVPPAAAAGRLPESQVVPGRHDIAWAWLGSPTRRYTHAALGSSLHAGSVHVLTRQGTAPPRALSLQLPPERVFEDRAPRLVDLDGDGRDEIVLVEAHAEHGAALVVLGLAPAASGARALVERARGPWIGTPQRWLNPAGTADFDGDGLLELIAVITPHLAGVLTLYRYEPPRLRPVASARGFSNHRNGTLEQQLTAIVRRKDGRPWLLVPSLDLRSLHAMAWDHSGGWTSPVAALALPDGVQRVVPLPDGACVHVVGGSSLRVRLRD